MNHRKPKASYYSWMLRASLSFWLTTATFGTAAEPGPMIEEARLFLSRPGSISLLQPAQPLFEKALTAEPEVRAIAVDDQRQRAWLRTAKTLSSFDAEGELDRSFPLESRSANVARLATFSRPAPPRFACRR